MFYYIIRIINSVKTALRRAYNPFVKRSGLIIDIGSGGMPYPLANVACDFYENDFERADLLKIDRPFVWASVEHLPFAEKTFDFSIFSHVLEHLDEPEKALKEIERVSNAGYIETPNAFYEFIIPHIYHMSRCTIVDDVLHITMKNKWDESLTAEFIDVKNDMMACWHSLNSYNSKALLTMFVWKNFIKYEIHGKIGFKKPIDEIMFSATTRPWWKKIFKNIAYAVLKPKKIDLERILRCPLCKEALYYNDNLNEARCKKCVKTYFKHRGCWDFRITTNIS